MNDVPRPYYKGIEWNVQAQKETCGGLPLHKKHDDVADSLGYAMKTVVGDLEDVKKLWS